MIGKYELWGMRGGALQARGQAACSARNLHPRGFGHKEGPISGDESVAERATVRVPALVLPHL